MLFVFNMDPQEFEKLRKIRFKQAEEKRKESKRVKEIKKAGRRFRWNKKQAFKLQNDQHHKRNSNELRFRTLLWELGIKYKWQQPFYDEERYVCVDFYFEQSGIVVEIDGKIHDNQQQYDLERTLYLKRKHKIKEVIRITNKQIATEIEKIKDLIIDKLE